MPTKRTYGDFGDACRAANALDLVGDRWTLIVMRELILGPKRFTDLQESVRGITAAVLTARLRSLRESGIIDQVVLPDLARTRAYVATEWGRGLESVLRSLGLWYSAGPDPGTSGRMTPDATVLAMRTMAPASSGEVPPIALRLHDGPPPDPPVRDYRVAAIDGSLDVRSGVAPEPAATVTAESTVWGRVLFDDLPLSHAERDGTVRVEGDRSAVLRVVRLYARP
ncbi:winged helix-turn-helix transcriptional regulator [Plantactinospora mayteni]|uniref:HxlR family transcriptional regulator n=1 Tax=Plantactinospora mayteni TaxID=566021 RepID=A0ABQ4F222_9ACTN|nr:helix-turn-helix domain-containing protein [Plantactinospora mayteni]GIH00953.1 HxlR family transcriptional regulator [Plantactinospora mayteni]